MDVHEQSNHVVVRFLKDTGKRLLEMLYENIYRIGGQRWNRTTDTRIFSPLLYRLSYLATSSNTSLESESAVLNRLDGFKSRIMRLFFVFGDVSLGYG